MFSTRKGNFIVCWLFMGLVVAEVVVVLVVVALLRVVSCWSFFILAFMLFRYYCFVRMFWFFCCIVLR